MSKKTPSTPGLLYRWQTQYDPHIVPGEINFDPSLTVPDQAMSIQEIMLRHMSGRPVPKNNNMFFGGDTVYPDMGALSTMDQLDMIRENEARINKLQQEMNDLRNKRIAAAKKADENKLLTKERQAQRLSDDDGSAEHQTVRGGNTRGTSERTQSVRGESRASTQQNNNQD